jgi:hypothetical protein
MSFAGGRVVRGALESGWLPNVVIGILLLAITQASLLGFLFASVSGMVFFVTTSQFGSSRQKTPQERTLYRAAVIVGYCVGIFYLMAAVFWCFRGPIAVQIPQYALTWVHNHAENARTKSEMPLIEGFEASSIFGMQGKDKNRYTVTSAENLSKHIVDQVLIQVDFYLAVIAVILLGVFLVVLGINRFAQFIWSVSNRGE